MLCYRDMTFCEAQCATHDCPRQWTDKHSQNARKWWAHDPDNAPVAFADFSETCPDFKEKQNDTN